MGSPGVGEEVRRTILLSVEAMRAAPTSDKELAYSNLPASDQTPL